MKSIFAGMLKSLLYKFRDLLTRFYDPLTPLAIGTCTIKAPLSHPLRRILADLPQFGFNITRLAMYIHRQYPDCPVIDIGANIGIPRPLSIIIATCPFCV